MMILLSVLFKLLKVNASERERERERVIKIINTIDSVEFLNEIFVLLILYCT